MKTGDKMDKMNLEQAQFLIKLIHSVVRSPYNTDKEAIEEIVKIFEMYDMKCGLRSHKFPQFFIHREE
ncbi:MAG: hypothetical protein IJ435_07330 [Clostridia bacterium]|nr:hypothetical protein [Clostridia bacterium]